jgi:crotonobetaine/carnitine-CoA ligase
MSLDEVVLSRIVAAEASRDPDRLLYVFENAPHPAEPVTARDLARLGNQIAAAFLDAGLRPGDRIGIMLRNHPEFVHTLVAGAKLGLPTVPIDPRAQGERLDSLLRLAGCAALVTADYVVADPAAASTIRELAVPTWILSTPEGRAERLDYPFGWGCLNQVLSPPRRPDVGEHVTDPAEPWLLLPTSGPTSERGLLEVPWARMPLLRAVPEALGYRSDDVVYTGLALTECNAIALALVPPLVGAADRSVISRRFSKRRLWRICIEYHATTWASVAEVARAIYALPSSDEDRSHTVRLVASCGMPPQIWRAFEERYGVSVVEWWGTMEGAFACNPAGVGPVGSFGKPPAGIAELDVVDNDGNSVPARTVGELVVRRSHGWLRTGEMVTRDEEGWLYAAHRRSDEPDVARPEPFLIRSSSSGGGRFGKAHAAAHRPLRRMLHCDELDGVFRFAGDAGPDVTDRFQEAEHGLVAATDADVDEDEGLVGGNTGPEGAVGGHIVEHDADQVVRRLDDVVQDAGDLGRQLGLHPRIEGCLLLYDDNGHSVLPAINRHPL